jgi:AAA15 family ATPase/GTPase
MKIKVKNLGALKQAEFTLGDLTIICGGNNTGKTYATYALFGFLHTWKQMLSIKVKDTEVSQLLADGVINIDIQEYVNQVKEIISKGCKAYTRELPRIFAAPEDRFKEAAFEVNFDTKNISFAGRYVQEIGSANTKFFSIAKKEKSTDLVVTLLVEKEKVEIPTEFIKRSISDALKEVVFSQFLPKPFIASVERTGAAIFHKELDLGRNRLLEAMNRAGKKIDPIKLLFSVYEDYPLPVKQDVDFARGLEKTFKKRSFIAEQHPEVLSDFADIIGGEYTVTRDDELYYLPKGKRVKLSMDASSSAVRSLLDIGFYLKHEAQYGDLLMVDEPELNLHPENQRRVARLFARLINLGIKVFITTHSDYIIKELNTLIMLNHDKPHLNEIAKKEGYRKEELLSCEKIKVYIAEEAPTKVDGNSRRTQCQTLTPANIDSELGIEARSFDTTIETMNRIQEAIVWGED